MIDNQNQKPLQTLLTIEQFPSEYTSGTSIYDASGRAVAVAFDAENNEENIQSIISSTRIPEEANIEVINRLSLLSPLDYDKVRIDEAKALGVRVGKLDKEVDLARQITRPMFEMFSTIQPWAEPVDGNQLLIDIQDTIKRFIICDEETVVAVTLWIAFTWFIDRFQVAPLAVITAPEKRCGKSQLLDLIGRLSCRPLVASNISPAAIFRVIEAQHPTLLIDEADTFMKYNEEIRGILNSGHTRQSAYVIRVAGDNNKPQQFSTWGAKAISGIGKLADTLMDRAIILRLRRKFPHEKVERLRHSEADVFKILASKLARFASDNGGIIGKSRPALPDELNDRAQDNWEPLLAIADYSGGNFPKKAREAAISISSNEHDTGSLSTELLADIKEVFDTRGYLRISSSELLEHLLADDTKPWQVYKNDKPMNHHQLANLLKEFGIKAQTIRTPKGTPKGFMKEWFDDAFDRYLHIPSKINPKNTATTQQNLANYTTEPVTAVADNYECCNSWST